MSVKHYPGVNTTVRFLFTTHAASGAAVAPSSAFEATDVRIYKDGSATQRNTENGYTMTSPFDSVTGLHLIAIDLSDNSDAGFYAAGSEYVVVLSPDETVDSLAVVRVIGYFRIVLAEGVAGAPKVDTHAFGGTAATTSGGRPEVNLTHVAGSTTSVSALATGVATLLADWVNGGRLDLLIDAIKAVTDAIPNSGSMSSIATASALSAAQSDLTTLLARLTALRAGYLDNLSAGAAALQSTAAAIKAVTDLLPDAGALSSLATAANLATVAGYLDTEIAAILAAVDTEVAAIKAKTDNLPADPADASDILSATNAIAAAIAALNNLSAAQVNAEVVDALRTDTGTEVSAVPAAAAPIAAQLQLLYQALRNKIDVTGSAKEVHTDAGAVVGTKSLSDDGTTYSETKMA